MLGTQEARERRFHHGYVCPRCQSARVQRLTPAKARAVLVGEHGRTPARPVLSQLRGDAEFGIV